MYKFISNFFLYGVTTLFLSVIIFTPKNAYAFFSVIETSTGHFNIAGLIGTYSCVTGADSDTNSSSYSNSFCSTGTGFDSGYYTGNSSEFNNLVVGGPQTYYVYSSNSRTTFHLSGPLLASGYFIVDSSSHLVSYFDTFSDLTTRILSVLPENGTTTQNPVFFDFKYFIDPNQSLDFFSGIKVTLHNIDQNVLLASFLSPSDIVFIDNISATSTGFHEFATSTFLGDGNYRIHAELIHSYLGVLQNPFTAIYVDHVFVVNKPTFIGNISASSFEQLNSVFSSSTATTTSALANSCNVLSLFNSFDPIGCVTFLLIPDSGYLNNTIRNFKDQVATHFPIGYLTDFYRIVSTSTIGTLTVIDAYVPSVLPAGNAHIRLDLTHIFDTVLNATSSIYNNVSASSTKTFYEITSYYWSLILYVLLGFYIIARIIGSHLIPNFWDNDPITSTKRMNKRGLNDDSYRLKETLYNMDHERGDRKGFKRGPPIR